MCHGMIMTRHMNQVALLPGKAWAVFRWQVVYCSAYMLFELSNAALYWLTILTLGGLAIHVTPSLDLTDVRS